MAPVNQHRTNSQQRPWVQGTIAMQCKKSALTVSVVGICIWLATAMPSAAQQETPKFIPGEEVKVTRDGFRGYFLVYTPSDYTADRTWPVILCFHGHNGKPTTWPFKKVTGGKGFIIVGLDYKQKEYHDNFKYGLIDHEIRNMLEISKIVAKQLKLDTQTIFIGGFSQGGYTTSIVAEKLLGNVAGFLVLGAGRPRSGKLGRSIQGKPVFVGVGETDKDHRPRAIKAAESYHGQGADVTFEEWKGLGHSVDANSEKMRQWLRNYGLLRRAGALLVGAQQADKAKRTGQALVLYQQAAAIEPTHETCKKAAAEAKRITDAANVEFAAVDALLRDDNRTQAVRRLLKLKRRYAGSKYGDKAEQLLKDKNSR